MSKFVDEEMKEQAKDTVDKAEGIWQRHKGKIIGTLLVIGGSLVMKDKHDKKIRRLNNETMLEIGRIAGRAELAEELAKQAINAGADKN